jgi:hypothetical protein
MNRRIVFPIANDVMLYVSEKRPSIYVPFKGNFPLLKPYQEEEYGELIATKRYLDELPDWAQDIIGKAEKIKAIDDGFKEYLSSNRLLETFPKMPNSEKADWLVRFLNASCLTLDSLKFY